MMTKIYRQANRALRVHGVLGSLRIAAEKVRHRPVAVGPSAYDQQWGVVTDGNEDLTELRVESQTDLVLCNRYQPTAEPIVREMIDRIGGLALNEFTFIDVGSGKGRVLLVASEYPFRKIIGVEFARYLHEIAEQNVRAYQSPTQRCRNIDLACADATTYALPPEPTVLFMANPFQGAVMAGFLANVEASLRQSPRPFYVLYRQAKDAAAWDASPSLSRMAETPMYTTWRAR